MRFARRLRGRSGRLGPLLLGAAALTLTAAGMWAVFAPHRASHTRHARPASATAGETTEEESPGSLGERHRDEEAGPTVARSRNRFGIEGPTDNRDPSMSREAAREQAAKAGVLGVLKQAPAPTRDSALGSDPMSALGALMGDQLWSNFGFDLGLRGTGRGGGDGRPIEAVTGRRHMETPSRPDKPARPRWTKREAPPQAQAKAQGQPGSPPPAAWQGVQFISANGYFANTYIPGDPELRALQARLRGYDRASLLPDGLRSARLEGAAQRVTQPFDSPGQAALAVYVSASERGLTGTRRMLVQVGLQATPRYSGRRPNMNVGLVLDARQPLDAAAHANVRALLAAFADARDPSDKLTLFAAGPGGGKLVAADQFRQGPLSVALQRLQTERDAARVSLPDALQAALQSVQGSDDPNAPLGSSVAVLIAPHGLGTELERLATLAHDSAVEGVPVSVFSAGSAADPNQLARIALAGQGNRRIIEAPADAAQAVDRELSAAARAVARAVRLRIRLASGVRLVSVLGSHQLDQERAEQVREAENSIDQRLRKNLGIAQDRGTDEEGVQIVIPSFYAGDSHVVLLDVVAEGPGLIADVNVRYKDLVQLENGSARESLWLPNLELARGPLERNVLKNRAAYELANHLRAASRALASDPDSSAARLELTRALTELEKLATDLPELRGDRELEQDRALTGEFLTLLEHVQQQAQRQLAADSLHLASLFKLQPRHD